MTANKIQHNFNRAANTYDQYAIVQQQIGVRALTDLIHLQKRYHAIADFACGTGSLTATILTSLIYEDAYAIDFSEQLLAQAKLKLANLPVQFILADINQPVLKPQSLDLIFCNMSLQWCELSSVLQLFYEYLQPGGWLVFTLPVNNNFWELKSRLFCYPAENIKKILNQFAFTAVHWHIQQIIQPYDTFKELLLSLKAMGTQGNVFATQYKSLQRSFTQYFQVATPQLTYEIATFIVKK